MIPRIAARAATRAVRASFSARYAAASAPGQPREAPASRSSAVFEVRLPDPEPLPDEPSVNIPSILPPEERNNDDSFDFFPHAPRVNVVSPASGHDGSNVDPERLKHLPSEGAPAEEALVEPDRGPGNPRTSHEMAAAGEQAVDALDGWASSLSGLLPSDRKEIAFEPVNRDLNQEERTGLVVLAGIAATGWLIGGLLQPRRKKKRRDQ